MAAQVTAEWRIESAPPASYVGLRETTGAVCPTQADLTRALHRRPAPIWSATGMSPMWTAVVIRAAAAKRAICAERPQTA